VFFDAAEATDSFVAGNIASFDEHNMVGFQLTLTDLGDITTLSIIVESSIDGGTTYGQQVAVATTGGTTVVTKNQYDFSMASYTAGDTVTFIVTPIKGDHLKVSMKADDSVTDGGDITLVGMFGWV